MPNTAASSAAARAESLTPILGLGTPAGTGTSPTAKYPEATKLAAEETRSTAPATSPETKTMGREDKAPTNTPTAINWEMRASPPENALERIEESKNTPGKTPRTIPGRPPCTAHHAHSPPVRATSATTGGHRGGATGPGGSPSLTSGSLAKSIRSSTHYLTRRHDWAAIRFSGEDPA